MQPTEIERINERSLRIRWSDGESRMYAVKDLRDACPCATCREKRNAPADTNPRALNVLSPSEAQPLSILGMKPIGNYAYGIDFSDGHNTGIYSFERLRDLGEIESS